MLFHIIAVVESTIPEATLEFKWKIPFFYYKKKPFCFLNVSHKRNYVDIVFSKGFQLRNNLDFLIGDGRNTYKSLRYTTLEEIDNKVLISVIEEAKSLS
ncbi:MAG: DUF1801 domain-containing protein [Flavobacterium sp. JAD_PAG50586_2]|nr:MAG: DUF1801 domain-containing protein [Flavobacterium sp. JAD_PAG50586_2]